MPTLDNEGNPRTDPLILKASTLPHGIVDSGAAGENVILVNPKPVSSHPSVDQVNTPSGVNQEHGNASPYQAVFLISMRIFLYLFVFILTLGLTLAACKLTNLWNPCDYFFINTTECKVTSYLKGMVYHTDCTEEYYCILPGFERYTNRQGWSLHKPNETANAAVYYTPGPISILVDTNKAEESN